MRFCLGAVVADDDRDRPRGRPGLPRPLLAPPPATPASAAIADGTRTTVGALADAEPLMALPAGALPGHDRGRAHRRPTTPPSRSGATATRCRRGSRGHGGRGPPPPGHGDARGPPAPRGAARQPPPGPAGAGRVVRTPEHHRPSRRPCSPRSPRSGPVTEGQPAAGRGGPRRGGAPARRRRAARSSSTSARYAELVEVTA